MALSQEWIFKKEFLEDENSSRFSHSTDVKKEKENRFKTIWFMKDLSNILRPGPTKDSQKDRKEEEAEYDIRNLKVFWTACTFFHRFYVFHSFDSHARFAVAVACLFLASKVEEKPLRLSDHIFLYFRLRKNKILKKTDQEFKDMERDVLLAERILLQTLSFDLNVVHPYQFFRQIIGKDLKAWFADADDGKLVLRLATTLLSDSFRSTLCLQYSEHQLSLAMVFMSLCILNLQPTNSNSMSNSYHRNSTVSGGNGNSGNDTTWLDLIEKDIDEQVLQNICLTLVEMYETPNSFLPADIPYPSHTALRSTIESSVQALSAARKEHSSNGSSISSKGNGSTTPPYVDTGVEEYKGSSPGEESASLKRKQLSPTSYSKQGSFRHAGTTTGDTASSGPLSTSKSRYTTLPPAFSDSISVPPPPPAGSSSPCYDAPTPRSVYRPKHLTAMATTANQAGDYNSNQMDHLASSVQSPELPPPPPESPMDSAHSTFSQAFFAQQQHQLNKSIDSDNMQDGVDTPAGSVTDTPTYMPPPPDTPGSMASTPNFSNLPQPGLHAQNVQWNEAFQHKKPRTDY